MNRRNFLGSLAVSTASQPKTVTVYLVKAELKCTADQAHIVNELLASLGQHFKAYPADWKITQRLYGAWEL